MRATLLSMIIILLSGCRKHHDINNIIAEIVILSVNDGHIYNIFALDRIHTHSYIAITDDADRPWSFQINNVDILGEAGELIMDSNAASSIIINKSTTSAVTFTNNSSNVSKTVQFTNGARFFIEFRNAREASDLFSKPHEEQRNILMALAKDAVQENFNVATH